MTYEMYRYVFLGGAIACGILLAVSVILFFTLRIPKVISDLTGRTARKAIEDIRRQNEQSGNKIYQSSTENLKRGKLTDKITHSGRVVPRAQTPFGTGTITEKISTQRLQQEATGEETTLLAEETTLLSTSEQTTLLTPAEAAPVQPTEQMSAFAVEFEITFIHTDEVIV